MKRCPLFQQCLRVILQRLVALITNHVILNGAVFINEEKLRHSCAAQRCKHVCRLLVFVNLIHTNINFTVVLLLERIDRWLSRYTGWSSVCGKLNHDRHAVLRSNQLRVNALAGRFRL